MTVASAASRTVDLVVIALVALAVLVLAITVWYWRATTPLHPSLEALEEMGRRRWRRRSPSEREAALARLRPPAGPSAPGGDEPVADRLPGSERVGPAAAGPVPAGHEAFAPPAPGTGSGSPDGAPLPPPRGEALARHPPVP